MGFVMLCISLVAITYGTARRNTFSCNLILYSNDIIGISLSKVKTDHIIYFLFFHKIINNIDKFFWLLDIEKMTYIFHYM